MSPGDGEARRPGGGDAHLADTPTVRPRPALEVDGAQGPIPAEIRARRQGARKGEHLFTYVAPRPEWVRQYGPRLALKVDGARLLRCPECVSDDLALRRALGTATGCVAEIACHHCGGRYDLELSDTGAGVDVELRAAPGGPSDG